MSDMKPLPSGILIVSLVSTVITSGNHLTEPEQSSLSNCSVSYSNIPKFCQQYYTNASFWLGTTNDTLRTVLESVKVTILTNVSDEVSLDTLQRHLCYYYYPLCDPLTGDIITECDESCHRLNGDHNYTTLLNRIATEIMFHGIEPPDGTCVSRYYGAAGNIPVSPYCVRTEDSTHSVQDSIGISCVPLPSDHKCYSMLSAPYYAPNVTKVTSNFLINIVTITQGLQDTNFCSGTLFSVLLCAYLFPSCDFNTSKLIPICPETCSRINAEVEECRNILDDKVFDLIPDLRVLIDNSDCFNTSTYYTVLPEFVSDKLCTNLTDDTLTLSTSEGTGLPVTYIVVISVGIAALLVVIFVIVGIILLKIITSRKFRHKCGYGQTKTMHACSNPSQSLPEKENFREFRISSTEGTICASSNPCHSIPVNDYYREEIRSTNKQARHSYSNLCQPLSVHGDYGKCRMSTTEDFMGTSSIPGQSFPVDGMSSEQLTEETMSTTKTIHTCSILCQSLPANGQLREDEITATSETIQSLTNLCQSLPVYDHYREHRMYTVESLHTCSNPSLVEDTYDTMPTIDVCNILRYIKVKFCDVLIPMEFINKQHSLGKGAFGIVHKGELVESDGSVTPIAIKTIKSSRLDSLKELVAETAIMKNFSHPNVLQLLGVCVDSSDDDMFKVILPYMPNGDLRGFLRKNRVEPTNTHDFPENIDECGLIRMCTDIAKGMEYLSDKRFVHRDLAARNCMVDVNLNVRVADFGLTRDIYSTEYYRIEKHTTLPVKWMALESLLDGYFDEKTDVWSYGVTCWEIFSLGRIPYPGLDNGNVITVLKHGKRLDKPILCSQKLYNLLQTTWLESAPDRPSFGEIVKTLIGSTLS